MNAKKRLKRLEETVERLKREVTRNEYCLGSGCLRCSGQCEQEKEIWETWIDCNYEPLKKAKKLVKRRAA